MRYSNGLLLVILALSLQLNACTPRQMIVDQLADALAAPGVSSDDDLQLLRDAAPFHLKLSEAVLAENPGHLKLAESVASGFTQYAYAFIAFEAEQIESHDARAAERLRQRAARMYQRAQRHALRALASGQPGLMKQLADSGSTPLQLSADRIGLAYWGAAAWGSWISLAKDDPEVLADLPLAVRLAELAWQRDPAWGQGALSSLLATFEAARPGGSQGRALAWFDLGIEQSGRRSVGAFLAKAEGHALPTGNRAQFESLLQQALSVHDSADSPFLAQNAVMRRRALWLIEKADDLF